MNPLIQLKTTPPLLIALVLLGFALLPDAHAVLPPPDGGYPGGNTAEGQNALFSLTTGQFNTAVGFLSLRNDTTGSLNTAIGAGTLLANTANQNTAAGAGALLSNTLGGFNTASGAFALFSNTTGLSNTATGAQALFNNTTANSNTAMGDRALQFNTTGAGNTAVGNLALSNNTSGAGNIALGNNAGANVTTANDVICIGAVGANVNNSCYIGRIHGVTSSGGIAVFIGSDGKLGTTTSSLRFKNQIKPMDEISEGLYALRPVTFCYNKEIDPAGTSQFGLVAEDVEKVNPDLVARDKEGKPYSVRYDQVNAMLLNEFLKEHRKVQELEANAARQEANIAQQQKQIESLSAGLQKVSAQLELSEAAPRTVLNDQ
jgi:hypothetical protein